MKEKKVLKKIVNCFNYCEVDETKVDNKVFKSNTHGLGADYLELFNLSINKYHFKNRTVKGYESIFYETAKNSYYIDYSNAIPILNV